MDVFWIGAETLNCSEHEQKCGLAGDTSGFFFFVHVLAAGKKEGGAIVIGYGTKHCENRALNTCCSAYSDFSSSSIHLLLRMVTPPSKDCPVVLGCILLKITLQYIHKSGA